ncbi:hypothetical protein E2C01_031062 [Portunus trituberculatus]|uniref:Uncharacterized protein n=1 Tax=Portunus trituberculatus TaxID=210409 RepID=A0A5B7EWL8_PORTR|nr:hypothetical protein [Portunus trituberculatus]
MGVWLWVRVNGRQSYHKPRHQKDPAQRHHRRGQNPSSIGMREDNLCNADPGVSHAELDSGLTMVMSRAECYGSPPCLKTCWASVTAQEVNFWFRSNNIRSRPSGYGHATMSRHTLIAFRNPESEYSYMCSLLIDQATDLHQYRKIA